MHISLEKHTQKKHFSLSPKIMAILALTCLTITTLTRTLSQEEAKQKIKKLHAAVQHSPDKHVLAQYAYLFVQADDLEMAAQHYESIYTQHPDDAASSYNLACILTMLNKHEQALPYYKKTLSLNPSHDEARLGFSKALLALGNFNLGLSEFEYRMENTRDFHTYYKYPTLDLATLKNKKIILLAEWGLGDTIHFVRYAKLLKEKGATVILQTFGPLVKLLSRCPYIDTVIQQGTSLPTADLRIPLMSLPLVFKTTLETIPAPIPYLYANPDLVQEWRSKINVDKTLKIGICWHAKPIYLEEHTYTRRSVPLERFTPLMHIPGCTFYSLQKSFGTDELNTTTSAIKTFGPALDEAHGAFMDTAAIIKNLDLVISADTSIVHLAGGLGTPVWVLLPYSAEWRWLHDRTDSPWYPDVMRLFRQPKPGDWNSVIHDIGSALETLLKKRDTA